MRTQGARLKIFFSLLQKFIFLLTLVLAEFISSPFLTPASSTPGLTSFPIVTDINNNFVTVINPSTGVVTKTIIVGNSPVGVGFNPNGSKAYISNLSSNTVSVIDTSTGTVTNTIGVGTGPFGVTFSPDGNIVYLANYTNNTLSVINPLTETVTNNIGVGNGPVYVAFNPDGTRVYTGNEFSNSVSIIDTATATVTNTINGVGNGPGGIAFSPNGNKVYVASQFSNTISVIDPATETITNTINSAQNGAFGVAFTPNGSQAYVSNLNSNNVDVITTATETITNTIGVGTYPVGVAFNPEGSIAYVGNRDSNNVSVIDPATETVTNTINGVAQAFGVSFSPQFVTGNYSVSSDAQMTSDGIGLNPIYGNSLNFAGGTLIGNASFSTNKPTFLSSGINFNAPLQFPAGGTINTNGNTLTFSGITSGAGDLTKNGAGTLILSADNIYSGLTTISSGTLTLTGSTSGLGGNILNNSALVFAQPNTSFFNNLISGTGTVTQAGSALLTLGGDNTYSGLTTVSSGILALTGSTSGLGGNILNNSTLVFAQPTNSSFNNVISGTGTLIKVGAGNLTLGGDNTYSGLTTVSSGILTLTGSTSGLGGNIFNNSALVFAQPTNSSFNNIISGSGTVTQAGTANLTLGGANTYSGLTTVSSGILTFSGSTSGLGGNILNNSALVFAQPTNSSFNNLISGSGTVTQAGSANLTLGGDNTYSGLTTVSSGILTFSGSTSGLGGNILDNSALVFAQPTNSSFNNIISGTGSLTQAGSANLTLGGDNTYSGLTTVSSGILTLTGSTSGLGGNILNNSALVFAQPTNSSFNNIISGTGTVTQAGPANLTFGGANTYSGLTTVSSGILTLTGNTSGLGGNILNNSALVFAQPTNSSFNHIISGTGTVTQAGSANLTFGGANTYSGLTTVSSGILTFTGSTSGLGGNILNNSALVFAQPTNSSFNNIISGTGTVTQAGPATLTLSGTSPYTGSTFVTGGALALNGSLPNSAVFVNSGATIKGSGSMRSLNLSGTISPGNSLRTFGNFVMNPSAIYLADVAANGTSDLIAVGGTAQLNGTLDVVTSASPQSLKGKIYTILTAAQGVNGRFANLISANRLKYRVLYLPTAVELVISRLQDFSDAFPAGSKSNPARMARYLDAFASNPPAGSDLANVINVLDGYLATENISGLTSALNQMQPSLFREFGFLSFSQATLVNKSVRMQQQYRREGVWENCIEGISPTRLASFQQLVGNQSMKGFLSQNSLSSGVGKPKRKGVLGFQDEGNIRGAPIAQRVRNEVTSLWIEPYGQVNHKAHNSHGGTRNGNVGIRSHTAGFSLGGDVQLCRNNFAGILGGYSNTPFHWKSHRGSGHMHTTNLGVYGTWMGNGGLYVDGQIIGGNNRFKSWRKIAFGTINRTAHESHRAFQLSIDGEIGYAMALSCFTLQPFLNLDYILVHEKSFRERGAQSLNLNIKSKTAQFLQSDLGATFYRTYVINETLVRPAIQLGWVQKRPFEHDARVKGGLVGLPQTLTVIGDNRVRNQFAPAVSLTTQFPNGVNIIANLSAEVFDGQNTGEALLKLGYDF